MAKLTKAALKGIVKECLMEILAEATVGGAQPAARQDQQPTRRSTPRSSHLDKMVIGESSKKKRRRSPPQIDVSAMTSDPVMAAIFQDTARTTLVEQQSAESKKGRPPEVHSVGEDLGSIFGDSSAKWAEIAFRSENSKK